MALANRRNQQNKKLIKLSSAYSFPCIASGPNIASNSNNRLIAMLNNNNNALPNLLPTTSYASTASAIFLYLTPLTMAHKTGLHIRRQTIYIICSILYSLWIPLDEKNINIL